MATTSAPRRIAAPRTVLRRAVGALSIAAAWAGLVLVVYLLLAVAWFARWNAPPKAEITLDPLPLPLSRPRVEISGRARPLTPLEIHVNGRFADFTFTDRSGEFVGSTVLPSTAREITVRTAGDLHPPAQATHQLRWSPGTFDARVDLCIVSPRLGLTWIAGRGTPGEELTLDLEPPADSIAAWVDAYGVFDLLVEQAPSAIWVQSRDETSPDALLPCRILADGEAFPLSRQVVVRDLVDLEKLSENLQREHPWWAETEPGDVLPRAVVRLRLPAAHPYFERFVQGDLPIAELVTRTVGDIGQLSDDPRYQLWFGREALIEPLLPRAVSWAAGGWATVRVETALSAFPFSQNRFSLNPERRSTPGHGGVSSRPLLTPRDRVAVIGRAAEHAFPLPPTRLRPGEAVWSGPLDFEELMVRSRVYVPSWFNNSGEQRQDEEAQTMRDFVRMVEHFERPPALLILWRLLLALVPAVVLFWFLRRSFVYAAGVGAPQLLALTLLAAIVIASPGLTNLVRPLLSALPRLMVRVVVDSAVLRDARMAWSSLGVLALWTVIITIVGASPLYLSGLTRALGSQAARAPVVRLRRAVLPALWISGVAMTLAWMWSRFTDPAWFNEMQRNAAWLPATMQPLDVYIPWALAPLLVLAALLVAAGLRGIAFFAVFVMAAIALVNRSMLNLAPGVDWILVAAAGLAAVLLTSRLVQRAIPVPWVRHGPVGVGVAISAATVFLVYVPPPTVLFVAAGLLGLGLFGAAGKGLLCVGPARRLGDGLFRRPRWWAIGCFLAGAAVGWPFSSPGRAAQLTDMMALAVHWRTVLPFVLALGLALLVFERLRATDRPLLHREEIIAGAVFYAVFLITPTTTWLLLPVPLLVALVLARSWIFKPPQRREELAELAGRLPLAPRLKARIFLESEAVRQRVAMALKAIHREFQSGKVAPTEYEQRVRQYRAMEELRSPHGSEDGLHAFAIGDGDFAATVAAFVRIGLLLATGPILISLYQYLPVSRVSYPFPIADFVMFLSATLLKWTLYALFFGLFFASLRGDTGLGKGLRLFVAVSVPFATYRLLGGASFEELRPFLFWLAQLFVFFGLLGLLAGDLRLVRQAGAPGRDLRLVHRLPALYTFVSAAVAALVPIVATALAGGAGDVVKFFIQMLLPEATGASRGG